MSSDFATLATIVVCEGDEPDLDRLCDHLRADRLEVLPAATASDALRLCRYHHPDLMVLDLALPDMAGPEVLRAIREPDGMEAPFDPKLPIIVLTERGRDTDRVRSLERGADDHVQKPFHHEELRARIAAVLRRRHSRAEDPVRVGEILIDPARRRVTVEGEEVHLSRKEFTLLRTLASDPTRVFGKDELLRDVWGLDVPAGRTRTLDSHASRLRNKLDPEDRRFVVNAWGIGYKLVESIDVARSVGDDDDQEPRR
ncbi:MAG: response regulator transcription factor [Actinobacteria bacterium]|nr:response regulator transcription factor [Actinomycetota bacterium]